MSTTPPKSILVFHGTGDQISTFDNRMTFFTPDWKMARDYAIRGGQGANVIAAYLKIENPKVFDFLAPNSRNWYAKRRGSLIHQGYDGIIVGTNVLAVFWADQIQVVPEQCQKIRHMTEEVDFVAIGAKHGISFELDPRSRGPGAVGLYDIVDDEQYVKTGIIGDHNALVELGRYLRLKGILPPSPMDPPEEVIPERPRG